MINLDTDKKMPSKESLVAYMHERHGAILVTHKGEGIEADVEHLGIGMDEFFNDELPSHRGLWMWEGTIIYQGPPDDMDVKYSGTWRRLTDAELQNLATKGDPWWKPATTQDWFNAFIGNQNG